ncbi:MAG TPA: glycine cleavage system protein H [Mycobacterium sp.]|nr:glycine cleavage system protein H [Mycobacterium sp.]
MSVDRGAWALTDRRYTDSHSWLALPAEQRLGARPLRVGITQAAVGEIHVISVELPRVGTAVRAGELCALIWSRPLSAMPVYAPITGVVSAVNGAVRADPGVVARDPLHAGWLFTVLPSGESSTDELLTASDYADSLGIGAPASAERRS